MSDNEFSNIFFKKNNEGKTTKVVIKKVQKKIKVKVKKPETTNIPQKTIKDITSELPAEARAGVAKEKPLSPFNKTDKPAGKDGNNKGGKDTKEKIVISRKKKEGRDRHSFQDPKSQTLGGRSARPKHEEKENRLNSTYQKEYNEFAGVPSQIEIPDIISIKNLALKLNLKAGQVVKRLFQLGVKNLTLNDSIDGESAQIVCSELGCQAKIISLLEQTKVNIDEGNPDDYISRDPVVTVMGHVDHGKTTLLDTIRSSKVASGEAGGITQHVGAYKVNTALGEVLFIDTPGHSAFSSMRSRGANLTDIVILVVSAVDGVKPQTVEAISHAKHAGVPIIVAINKMDAEGANPDRVKKQLAEYELLFEEWGGEVPVCNISALKNEGIKELLETVIKVSQKHGIKGNKNIKAYGYVLESEIQTGLGNTITVIIKNGTLKESDIYLCGKSSGKIRAFFDEHNKRLKTAGPSSIVKIVGLTNTENAGELFQLMESEKEAKRIVDKRADLERENKSTNVKKINLNSSVADVFKESHMKELNVILKTDTFGSLEAIKATLAELKNEEIKVDIIHSGIGAVVETDANLAKTAGANIIAFKVKPMPKAKKLAEQLKIELKTYDVIYKIIDDIKDSLSERLGEEVNEKTTGVLEVKEVFKITQIGRVAGCEVLEGKISKSDHVKIVRDEKIIYKSEILSLRRFKDEVAEVVAGMECGVSVKNYQDLKVGDKLESYVIEKIDKTFSVEEPATQDS